MWVRWSSQITDLMLVKITHEDKVYILHVESFHEANVNTIFLPEWCFINVNNIQVTIERVEEMPPLATKIILQPLDIEVYHCDISTAVSEYLSNWQVLSVGTTLSIPCRELGGFHVDIFVKAIDPAPTVLLRGEVPLELDEPIETVAEWIKKTTPIPLLPPSPQPYLPLVSTIQNLFPDEEESIPKLGFIPFSGKGNNLR